MHALTNGVHVLVEILARLHLPFANQRCRHVLSSLYSYTVVTIKYDTPLRPNSITVSWPQTGPRPVCYQPRTCLRPAWIA